MVYIRRRRVMRKRRVGGRRRYGRRGVAGKLRRALNPTPTFTETFALPVDNLVVPGGGGIGKAFKIRFNNIPQWTLYEQLYTQYRINWVKVMLLPQFNTNNAEVNQFIANAGGVGMMRVAYSIQNSPNVQDPANEAEVLEDNGAKIRSLGTKWSCSFKPVPNVNQSVTGGGLIPTKQRYRQWFNIDRVTTANNPEHGAVSAFFTLPGFAGEGDSVSLFAYYKVNFTLRDPK